MAAYLWSVPLALMISDVLDWSYDGGPGWWLVAGWTAPVVFVASWFRPVVSEPAIVSIYFIVVIAFTAYTASLASVTTEHEINS
jgi:hypothetical protein